ncbi:hypothetical protein [Carboxydothermus ferrireducens]|uniref:Prefoldin subunit 5 n=1 Tax=Carboxydothermus ferrireducens DSM 11255 TaxID=1119529 RepID=A0ABX2R722_9THEO|nr:hypothetical protein [Carboxydothermus ferrireducens]NYE56754.1 prefoldin subunit 5 [Carboxydothermus ferrireducens DSM 11255]
MDYAEMSLEQLQEELKKLKETLEEVEEEKFFVLGQSGFHVSGGKVKQYEQEISELQAKIKEVERLIKEKSN